MRQEEIKKIANDDKVIDKANDKLVITSHNVIPSGRQINKDDIDNFVEKIKEEKK
jgi:hypothetical protein